MRVRVSLLLPTRKAASVKRRRPSTSVPRWRPSEKKFSSSISIPQGNASTGLGISVEARLRTSFDVLTGGATILDAVMPTAVPGLFAVPANSDLVGIDSALAADQTRPSNFAMR